MLHVANILPNERTCNELFPFCKPATTFFTKKGYVTFNLRTKNQSINAKAICTKPYAQTHIAFSAHKPKNKILKVYSLLFFYLYECYNRCCKTIMISLIVVVATGAVKRIIKCNV